MGHSWRHAVDVHTHLNAGGTLEAIEPPAPGLLCEPGEYAVAVLANGMSFERYLSAPIPVPAGGPQFVIGAPAFVLGYAATSLVMRRRQRRRLRRAATPQWRTTPLNRVVVTTRRLWCELHTSPGPRWLRFDYDTITTMALTKNAVTIQFLEVEPLRLSGSWAPWCAAVVGHHRFGAGAAAVMPELQAAVRNNDGKTVRA